MSRCNLPQPQHQRQSYSNFCRRSSMSHQQRLAVLLVFLFAIITSPIVAQPPPGPQPGSQPGIDPSPTATSDGNNTPTKTQSNNSHPAVTNSSSAAIQVVSTVTVISGTTTTIVSTITSPQSVQQVAPAASSLPNAPQSVFVIQSATYGKALPAAGPSDDQSFWGPTVGMKSSAYVKSSPSLFLCFAMCSLLIAAGLVNI